MTGVAARLRELHEVRNHHNCPCFPELLAVVEAAQATVDAWYADDEESRLIIIVERDLREALAALEAAVPRGQT